MAWAPPLVVWLAMNWVKTLARTKAGVKTRTRVEETLAEAISVVAVEQILAEEEETLGVAETLAEGEEETLVEVVEIAVVAAVATTSNHRYHMQRRPPADHP